ncbi:MAG: alpha-isopropylmalate synthase regulatory domain-containing protein, partial [Pseudolactococcus laudensis]
VKKNSLPLGKLSGRHAFLTKLQDLGFDEVTEDDMKELFSKFKVLADKKHEITDADIRALVAGTTVENPEGFQFDNLFISSNDDGTQTVTISLKNEGEEIIETTANGSGSVEATFNAIDQFFNQSVKLDSYNIIAVTEGIDAQAEVHVTVENNDTGTIFNANGLDFDVLRASAIAYVNANTLVQRENAGIITRKISEKANPED